MRVNVNHCVVIKVDGGFKKLLPADGPHEVADAIGKELIDQKAAVLAPPAPAEPEDDPESERKPKGKGGK